MCGGAAIVVAKLCIILEFGDHHAIFYFMVAIGTVLGTLFGLLAWLLGYPPPEWAWVGTCTCGFFLGYATVEFYLRRADRRNKEFNQQFNNDNASTGPS